MTGIISRSISDISDNRPVDGPPRKVKHMRKVALITAAVLSLVACDDPQTFDGSTSENDCEVPDLNPEGEQDPDSTPSEPDPGPGKTLIPQDDGSVHIPCSATGSLDQGLSGTRLR